MTNWGIEGLAAFDVIVIPALNPSIISEAGVTAGVAARAAEMRKHEENDAKCTEFGWILLLNLMVLRVSKHVMLSLFWQGVKPS